MKISSLLLVFLLSFLLINCSSKKEETELYTSAKTALDSEKYYDALITFNELLNEYPKGNFTAETIFEIGKLNHGKVDTSLSPKESYEKAVLFYVRLQNEYPENPKSAEALFMASFILANEIGDYKRAEESYKSFLEKYPNSELVESAKSELENLGIPPEEILKKKVAAEN